ncbi:MAG: hypothetical protein ACFFKA_00645 [Candidatus Thorarchaeota archaeon]
MKKVKKTKKLPKGKIPCSKCGTFKGVSKDRIIKLIALFGTLESIYANYVCTSCRKEHNVRKDGRIKPEKRQRKKKVEVNNPEVKKIISNWKPQLDRTPASNEELKSTDVCWRPDIWFGNGNACNGCKYFEQACGCIDRKMISLDKLKKNHEAKGYNNIPEFIKQLTYNLIIKKKLTKKSKKRQTKK